MGRWAAARALAIRHRGFTPRVGSELQAVQFGVETTCGEELRVAACLDQAAMVEDEDAIHLANRRQAMRNDQSRAVREQLLNTCLEQGLGLSIDAGSRLVQDKNFWIICQRSRQ
jgi:hypothetical protein